MKREEYVFYVMAADYFIYLLFLVRIGSAGCMLKVGSTLSFLMLLAVAAFTLLSSATSSSSNKNEEDDKKYKRNWWAIGPSIEDGLRSFGSNSPDLLVNAAMKLENSATILGTKVERGLLGLGMFIGMGLLGIGMGMVLSSRWKEVSSLAAAFYKTVRANKIKCFCVICFGRPVAVCILKLVQEASLKIESLPMFVVLVMALVGSWLW
jgi:hypothetical protein